MGKYFPQITNFLSKASGLGNIHQNDENFGKRLRPAGQQGFSKRSDGILGPGMGQDETIPQS
jgi:hypothetical protein